MSDETTEKRAHVMNNILNTNHRASFETFKSNVCHLVKDYGDIKFMITLLETNKIHEYWNKQFLPESFYLLAMLDYLSRENDIELCNEYDDIRCRRLTKILYPTGVLILSKATQSDEPKEKSLKEAIPEFLRFNIVEAKIRDVC